MKRYYVQKGNPITPQYLRSPKQGPTGPAQQWTLNGADAVKLAEIDARYEQQVAGGVLGGVRLEKVATFHAQPTCMLCPDSDPRPATAIAGDWDLCDDHHEAITAPWPEEMAEAD